MLGDVGVPTPMGISWGISGDETSTSLGVEGTEAGADSTGDEVRVEATSSMSEAATDSSSSSSTASGWISLNRCHSRSVSEAWKASQMRSVMLPRSDMSILFCTGSGRLDTKMAPITRSPLGEVLAASERPRARWRFRYSQMYASGSESHLSRANLRARSWSVFLMGPAVDMGRISGLIMPYG